MALAYDTLGFSKALQRAGVPVQQADAQAEAIRDHVMPELATKADIAELKHMIERQTLQITVRLGGLIVIGVGVLAALKLLP